MKCFIASVKLYFHCLFRFHRIGTWREGLRYHVLECSTCKKVFWYRNEARLKEYRRILAEWDSLFGRDQHDEKEA